MREVEFGQRLQAFHPSTRGEQAPPAYPSLQTYEVNSGPAIRRTLQTLVMTSIAGEPLSLTDEDRLYIEWIRKALTSFQRIAGRCWSPMRTESRTLVLDEDDLGPGGSPYLTGAREFSPGPALRFAELDSAPIAAAIDDLVTLCRATPCYQAAFEQLARLEADRQLRDRLARRRQGVLRQITPEQRMRIGEMQSRAYTLVQGAYERADPVTMAIATAIRAYNQLVNYVLWALLGLAERDTTTRFGTEVGAVRARRGHRLLWVHFATSELDTFLGHPPAPFVLESGTPVDGLYMLEGSVSAFSGRELVDVHARRIRDLEDAPSAAGRGA